MATRRIHQIVAPPPVVESDEPYDPEENQYPKHLYTKDFAAAHEAWKEAEPGPKKDAALKAMDKHTVVVEDPEEEADHDPAVWKSHPADHLPKDQDPRVPRGVELAKSKRKAAAKGGKKGKK